MKNLIGFMLGVVVTGAVALLRLEVPLVQVATLAAGLAALAWLLVVIVMPWNLVFQAKRVVAEAARSRAAGLAIDEAQVDEAKRLYGRMWKVAVALHLGSAACLGLSAVVWGERLAAIFAVLFLVSTVGRPAIVVYGELRRRLTQALTEVTFPRDDVAAVRAGVQRCEAGLERLGHVERSVEERLEALAAADEQRRRQLEAVTRRFEETVDRLTDNREIVSGLKAFLRLVHSPTAR
ncbi:MAG: hypothetical protein JNJ54_29555 [Myxococcaceae bacterium]|nr:hypothetical protein [Myxococcaceae bacterium]